MNKSMIATTALLVMFSAASMVHAANGSSMNIKTGSFSINEQTQNIGGTTVTFDDASDSVFSIEYESEFGNNLSWGVEVLNYSNDILAGTSADDASSLLVMGTIRKYFDVIV